ncbi:MAG TPA: ATP-dependent 6-phosphofructokinase [Actinomycetota bacterium]|jgi:6-phosphofructokinase 1
MRLGILTGGGDCPGLNAAIRSVVRSADDARVDVLGFRDGWRGVLDGTAHELSLEDVRGILPRGGTILGTSGVQPHRAERGPALVREALEVHGLDGFLVVGGEGTMGASAALSDVPVIGIPKTIDNDIRGTDASIGFWTAAQIATDLIDRLYSTAESHRRVMVCEVMGRTAGWIGLTAGVAAGADVILIPECRFDIQAVARRIRRVHSERRPFSIVVVSEGAMPVDGTLELPPYELDENGWPKLGGIGRIVAEAIEDLTRSETRVTTLGHVQRGGSPVAFDRVLATRLGAAAVAAAREGRWGVMVGARGTEIHETPLAEVAVGASVVPPERWQIPEVRCD